MSTVALQTGRSIHTPSRSTRFSNVPLTKQRSCQQPQIELSIGRERNRPQLGARIDAEVRLDRTLPEELGEIRLRALRRAGPDEQTHGLRVLGLRQRHLRPPILSAACGDQLAACAERVGGESGTSSPASAPCSAADTTTCAFP